jgi:uncharacterized Zn-binding protein involved in type VI secretion
MPACAKDGDLCTGHGGFAPRTNTTSSPTVFVNGVGVIRVDDEWASHTYSIYTHTGKTGEGSTTVLANGRGVARIGDHIIKLAGDSDCVSSIAVGSGNVFVGG